MPADLEERVQVVASKLSERASGVPVTVSAAFNVITAKGLEVLERDLGIARPSKPPSPKAA